MIRYRLLSTRLLGAIALVSVCLAASCGSDEPRNVDREVAQLETVITALEKRIQSGEYPALQESLERQLEERRAELDALRQEQARQESGD